MLSPSIRWISLIPSCVLSVSELVIFKFSLGKLFTVIEQDSGIVKNKLVLSA